MVKVINKRKHEHELTHTHGLLNISAGEGQLVEAEIFISGRGGGAAGCCCAVARATEGGGSACVSVGTDTRPAAAARRTRRR